MSIPKYNEFMKPILIIFNDKKEHIYKEIYKELATHFQLTKEEMEERIPSGRQLVYKNRIGWAMTYLKKAGLIESHARSSYIITEEGIKVVNVNPEIIDSKYLKRFDSFKEFTLKTKADGKSNEDEVDSVESPQEQLDRAYRTITNTLSDGILQEIMGQSPDFFEKLVVDLLVAMGYGGSKIENSKVLGKSGDEGIDGIIKEDKLGFDVIYIQAKQWDPERTVSRPELQKFVGALTGQGATKGAFITTAKFSSGAIDYVKRQHACKIVLIDGNELTSLMIEHNLGVSIEDTYHLKRIDIDYFNSDEV